MANALVHFIVNSDGRTRAYYYSFDIASDHLKAFPDDTIVTCVIRSRPYKSIMDSYLLCAQLEQS